MRKALAFTVPLFVVSLFMAAVSLGQGGGEKPQISNGPKFTALVYHETTGFRHASIPYAIEQLEAYGEANGFEVTADQTSAQFTDEGLAQYDVVIWLSTVGGVRGDAPLLTAEEWAAFERYIQGGGGYAGIHAASDCCNESEWYGELLGNQARFNSHPGGLGGSPGCIGNRPGDPNVVNNTRSCFEAVVETEDGKHPSTRHLPERWEISDELYNFNANPRSTVHVLQTLDESSYDFQPHPFIRNWGNLMGEDHPITWCQIYDGARIWYTGLGHDANIFANHDSMAMIVNGIKWSAGKWGLKGCDQEG
ncbi:MAG TPA: ThuA domain-containing protein [Solirubrobacterales bacterium]|nr:ThuA domain-containing protein [Solirubrobacterales bacterium]